ncbi:hypothetical protein HNY73_006112 [Argiope bruennichi]|uniref:Uncharacterized protein n=1 Tax=Argiope bruennichi TaxID=94029 RepID=A0A8T0FJM0_ARGBR|nr:hypothetical protein HNY73_006112 [Argiope bruennichi]
MVFSELGCPWLKMLTLLILTLFIIRVVVRAIRWHSSTTMRCSMLEHDKTVEHCMVVGECDFVKFVSMLRPLIQRPIQKMDQLAGWRLLA